MNIGEKIKIARENAGLTQEELGRKCGTTKQTIYKYETGKITNIPMDRLELIAANIGVSAASLMGWSEKENQPTETDGLDDLDRQILALVKLLPLEQKQALLVQLRFLTDGR